MTRIATEIHGPRPFDQPLERADLDIDDKKRVNLLAWRGQFSPQFVQAILESYTQQNDVILDPFVGSGTVLVESAHLGHDVYGFEVNPAAEILAKIYTFTGYSPKERRTLLSRTEKILSEYIPLGLPLFDSSILSDDNSVSITPLIRDLSGLKCVDSKILIESLIVKLDLDGEHFPIHSLWSKWNALRTLVESLPRSQKTVSVALGDARYLPLDDAVIDFVLTSPPYINVFNYHNNYRTSIELLGWNPLVSAKSEIGANRKFRQNRFLTVVQYCIDMSLSLAELVRVCRSSGRIIFVVGRESNVHKTAFFNGAILRRLAEEIIGIKTALQQARQFQNKFGNLIKEDILHFIPDNGQQINRSLTIEQAKQIGADVLSSARDRVPTDRHGILDDALSHAHKIEPSPEFIAAYAKESKANWFSSETALCHLFGTTEIPRRVR